jgi:hypothetical protein
MTPAEHPDFELPPEAPPMSEAGRLIGVFVSPKEAFAAIAKRPSWWAPILLTTIVATAYLYLFSQQVGWDTYILSQMERSNSPMPAQQRAQFVALLQRIGPAISICLGLFGTILGSLIMAGILKVVADGILSAELGFKRILAAVAYGGLPNILKILLAAVVMQYKPPDEFDLNNPLVFHLGALLSNDTPLWLQTLGGSFELFTFWSMFLTAMGLGSVSKKMRTGKAFGMILFLWAAAVILSVGWVAISGTAR